VVTGFIETVAALAAAASTASEGNRVTTYITYIRMSPPNSTDHQHISEVRWSQPGQTGECSRAAMVEFINKGNPVFVQGTPDVQVGVVDSNPPYLRTYADGNWSNNLLSLPRF
jgi:hypothetical protein